MNDIQLIQNWTINVVYYSLYWYSLTNQIQKFVKKMFFLIVLVDHLTAFDSCRTF